MSTLIVYSGDTTILPVTITEDGSAYDITGHTLSWLVSKTATAVRLLQIDVTEHDNASGGLSSIELTPANLATIGGPGSYYLTCIDVNAEGDEITRAVFQLQILDRIQRQ